jgi:histidinol phosphatase-like enzyme
MFEFMTKIARELDYELIMVTNQDGLGSPSFPENAFWPVHNFVMKVWRMKIFISVPCILIKPCQRSCTYAQTGHWYADGLPE